jgi:hypothetical protein
MMQPQRVIVYRSVAEQRQDEYLWGDGFFSPTGATDILIIMLFAASAILLFSRKRRRF